MSNPKRQNASAHDSGDSLDLLSRYVVTKTGLKYLDEKPEDLRRILSDRMKSLLFTSEVEYLNFLQDGEPGRKEFETLVKELTVGETYFFRHREQFEAFKKSLPELFANKAPGDSLRVWSAGCSNGAELYSVSMLLREHFAESCQEAAPHLVGTDINADSLAKAIEGSYEEWSLRGVGPEERARFFDKQGKRLRVKDEFRHNVSFHFHNLACDPIPSSSHNIFALDFIFLRNVLIYFDIKSLRPFLGKIHEALVPGGYLAVAPAEVGPDFEHWFETVPFEGSLLYRKSDGKKVTVGTTKGNALSKPVKLHPLPPPPVDTTEATLEAAMAGANQGKLAQARTLLESLVKKDSLNYEAHYLLGIVNHNLGEAAEAKENLRRVFYLRRDFWLASFQLGLIHAGNGEADEAKRIWEHAEEKLTRREPSEVIYAREGLTAGDLLAMVRAALGKEKGKS